MIANLNLASQPFRNRVLPWTIISVITIASLVALIWIVSASNQTNAKADVVERELAVLRNEASALQGQAEEVKSALTPEQQQTLDAAQTLVDRKRFSWSRLFTDLESALPSNVRVTRIGVRDVALRGDQTYAELDVTVVGKVTDDVTNMITEMDRTGIFQAQPVSQNMLRGRGESGTEWVLAVRYMPRAGASTAPPSRADNSIAAVSTSARAKSDGVPR